MRVTIPYGNKKEYFDIPDNNLIGVYSPNAYTEPVNPELIIEEAIDNPIGTPPLEEIVFRGCSVNIICDDITRPTPVKMILGILIPKLIEYGVDKKNIKIILALGSHRYMTEDEIIAKVGTEIYREFIVLNSEFRDKRKLENLGKAPDGVEIWVNKDVMDCDIRIGIGNIVPHPAMGWSGGGKIIYPGVTGEDTVAAFHIQHGLAGINMFGMEDCPVRLKMEKWVDTVGLHFIINTVLTPEKKLFRAVAGHYVAAQRKGVEYAKLLYGKKVTEKSDIVVVSSFPVDIDFWQATKGVLCGDHILNDGGTLILVTPCYEEVGPHKEYIDQIGNDNAEEMLRKIEKGESSEDDPLALAIGTTISRIRKRINLALVSEGITQAEADTAKFEYFESIQEAVDKVISRYENPKVSVITHGGELYLYK